MATDPFLLSIGYISFYTAASAGVFACSLFSVTKPNGLLRPIVNPDLNAHLDYQSTIVFPSPLQLITTVLDYEWATDRDLRSWFSQIPNPSYARKLFVFRFCTKLFCINVLPQGFKMAPELAQTLSNILAQFLTGIVIWIDNFLLLGRSVQDVLMKLSTIQERATKAGAIFKPSNAPPTQTPVFVGYHFHMGHKKWHLDPDFVMKHKSFVVHLMTTAWKPYPIRMWWKLFGILFWVSRVFLLPPSFFPRMRQHMTSVQKLLHYHGLSWEDELPLPLRVHAEISRLVDLLVHNPWKILHPPLMTLPIITDAHISGAALLIQHFFVAWPHSHIHHTRDMPLLELKAVLHATCHLAYLKNMLHLRVHSDCSAVVNMINRGKSGSPKCDLFLAKLLEIFPAYTHISAVKIPTGSNAADSFSRMFQHSPDLFPVVCYGFRGV